MKLSEAMRMGALVYPQAFGISIARNDAKCAVMTALVAVGVHEPKGALAIHVFPSLARGTGPDRDVMSEIIELNDEKRLSREQIADIIVANGWDCDYVPPATEEAKQEEPCLVSQTS